jgi:hypothetical protein
MKNLTKPILLAAAFLALVSVVQAAKRHRPRPHTSRPAFTVSGNLGAPLHPGSSQPIGLALTNRTRSALWITALRIRLEIDATHAAAGCSADRDFSVTPLPVGAFPILLPARRPFRAGGWPAPFKWNATQTWPFAMLGVTGLPSVAMHDLPQTNQDACKGASLRFTFTGTARRVSERAVRRP